MCFSDTLTQIYDGVSFISVENFDGSHDIFITFRRNFRRTDCMTIEINEFCTKALKANSK